MTDETLRLVEDTVARRSLELVTTLRNRRPAGLATVGVESTLEALAVGRVEHLLLHDDPSDDRRTCLDVDPCDLIGRVVDVAIVRALATDAGVRIVPRVASLTDGIGALLRS